MIDLITVVFGPELDVLKLQARSMALYVDSVDSVVIVLNDDDLDVNDIDTEWWGSYQSRVKIVHRRNFGLDWSDNGWVSQQALKLLATKICGCDWALILDAKTIFVEKFAKLDPRPQIGQLGIYPVFEPSRRIANALFGTDLQQQLGPGGVPFVINVPLACEMMSWIESHTKQTFATWFQAQGRLTEFILYSAWIQHRTGSLDAIYDTTASKIRPVNVCHSEVAIFEHKLQQMSQASTVSIHRNAWTQLSQSQQQQYLDFLHSRDIQ